MEDLLELYAAPVDPQRPRVCFDEVPVQLLQAYAPPTPPQPGTPAHVDYSYRPLSTANLFVAFCPDTGTRTVTVTARRTQQETAHQLKTLVDETFPDAVQLHLVVDNLTAHKPAVLYATFPPAEARRIARKLIWHYTPKHGSWLNMVEIENSVLARQCLATRYADLSSLTAALAAWVADRNAARATVDWRFTASDARTTLRRLYPTLPTEET